MPDFFDWRTEDKGQWGPAPIWLDMETFGAAVDGKRRYNVQQ